MSGRGRRKGREILQKEKSAPPPKKSKDNMVSGSSLRIMRRTIGILSSKISVLQDELKKNTNYEASLSTVSNTNSAVNDDKIVYNIQNVSIEKPKFSKKSDYHPVTFIEDLSNYIRKIRAKGKEIEVLHECFEGEAQSWFRVYKNRWVTYEDFKQDFLHTYWGEADQSIVRRSIVYNKWDKNKHSTMLGHFLTMVGQTKFLTYEIPEKQLVSDLMRHFTVSTQQLWSISRGTTILEAAEFLRIQDDLENFTIPALTNLRPQTTSTASTSTTVSPSMDRPSLAVQTTTVDNAQGLTTAAAGSFAHQKRKHLQQRNQWKRPETNNTSANVVNIENDTSYDLN